MEALTLEDLWFNCNGSMLFVRSVCFSKKAERVILLLHDGLGSVSQWKDFPERLARETHSKIIAYDRPGYGRSQQAHLPRGLKYLEEEADVILPCVVKEYCNSIPYVLFGHSDGGSIALAAARNLKPSPSGIIVEAPHSMIEETTLQGVRQVYAQRDNEEFVARLQKYHGDKTSALLYWWTDIWLHPDAIAWNIFDRLLGLDIPLLFIQGEEDEFGTLRQWEEVKQRVVGRAEAVIIPKCGHVPHLQAREIVMEAVRRFLSSL